MHAIAFFLIFVLASFAFVSRALRLQASLDPLYRDSEILTEEKEEDAAAPSFLPFQEMTSSAFNPKIVLSSVLFMPNALQTPFNERARSRRVYLSGSGSKVPGHDRIPLERSLNTLKPQWHETEKIPTATGAGTKRKSAVDFWDDWDMSGGAGSISSPVIGEHYKDAAEAAMYYERLAANLLEGAPPWLLFSTLAAVAREIASRRVQQGIVPDLVQTDPAARKKANSLAKQLRKNFDDRIQNALKPGAFSSGGNFIRRIVDAELELSNTFASDIGQVVSSEVAQAFAEVIEAETVGRIQRSIGDAVQLNQSSAERDLSEIMTRADVDGNEMITFDEFYELVVGSPINPVLEPLARQWPVLKSASSSANSWEMFISLLIAPQVKRLSRVTNLARTWYDRNVDRPTGQVLEDVEDWARDGFANAINSLREAFPDHIRDVQPVEPVIDVDATNDVTPVVKEIVHGEKLPIHRKAFKWLRHRLPHRLRRGNIERLPPGDIGNNASSR